MDTQAGVSPNKWSVPLVFVAGIALGAVAVVGVQWLDKTLASSKEPAKAAKAQPPAAAKEQSGVLLMPGEQLVLAPEPPATQIPKPAPAESKAEATKPAAAAQPSPPRPARAAPTIAQDNARPAPPRYLREERRGTSYDRARSVCLNCGVVTSVTRFDEYWEVRVRFDDGARETVRYYDSPPLHAGDAVHFQDGRLIRD